MLDLSFERTLGTHPYFTPVQHTRVARERLGGQALVAPELAVVVDEDRDRARAAARKYSKLYLDLANYTGNLKRLGWSDEDLANGGSDRLIDAVVPQGSAAQLAVAVQHTSTLVPTTSACRPSVSAACRRRSGRPWPRRSGFHDTRTEAARARPRRSAC